MESGCRAFLAGCLAFGVLVACGSSETSTATPSAPAGDAGAAPVGDGGLDSILGQGAAPRNVVWVGAHPDDEGYAAPILWELCKVRGATCHFVVVTDGGKGNCKLGNGACGTPNAGGAPAGSVGAFRLAEMRSVVDLFGGKLVAMALEDTPSDTVQGAAASWNRASGGGANDANVEQVTAKIASALQGAQADLVVTFDPRHGVYCHPDHRAAGALAVTAAAKLGLELGRVLMVEGTEPYLDATGILPAMRAWVPEDPKVRTYDAARSGTWNARRDVYALHRSQFTADILRGLDAFPPAARIVPVLAVADVVEGGKVAPAPAYDAICASQNDGWEGHGVCPRADGSTGHCW